MKLKDRAIRKTQTSEKNMDREDVSKIPLVLAAEDRKAILLFVTLTSILEHAKESTVYEVHLLLYDDFSEENRERLELVTRSYPRHSVIVHRPDDLNLRNFAFVDYHRLMLPSLLPEVEKCICLDTNLVVLRDLSKLYQINIDGQYLAGVRAAEYYWPDQRVNRKIETLELPSIEQYIDTGVLLMNLAKMRNDHMEQIFEALIHRNFDDQEQDVLNKACYGKIRLLPPRYNLMTDYDLLAEDSYKRQLRLQMAYTLAEWNNALERPVIIHYKGELGPWNDLSIDYSEQWWKIAAKLPFFQDVFMQCIPDLQVSARRGYSKIQLEKEVQYLKDEMEVQKAEAVNAVKSTVTFKVGAAAVYIPRMIKNGLGVWKLRN